MDCNLNVYFVARWWGSKDRQPIICIHGWQDNSATFNALIPLLPEQISFLCIDLPGHGRSTSLPAVCFLTCASL